METQHARTTSTHSYHGTARVSPETQAREWEALRSHELFEHNAEWILKQASLLCRRNGMSEQEAADFASWVAVRLLDRNFAVLRACRQPGRLRSYLRTVIGNLLKDYRNHVWGKWRPSSSALRRGLTAVELERLWRRDGFLLREAIEILRANRGCAQSVAELEALAGSFPSKPKRRLVPLDEKEHGSSSSMVAEVLATDERQPSRERVLECLNAALKLLEPREEEILKLHYENGQSLAAIARQRQLNQRALYSLRDRCLKQLRCILEDRGLSWQMIAPLFPGLSA